MLKVRENDIRCICRKLILTSRNTTSKFDLFKLQKKRQQQRMTNHCLHHEVLLVSQPLTKMFGCKYLPSLDPDLVILLKVRTNSGSVVALQAHLGLDKILVNNIITIFYSRFSSHQAKMPSLPEDKYQWSCDWLRSHPWKPARCIARSWNQGKNFSSRLPSRILVFRFRYQR